MNRKKRLDIATWNPNNVAVNFCFLVSRPMRQLAPTEFGSLVDNK
jgi:hypothetical protein